VGSIYVVASTLPEKPILETRKCETEIVVKKGNDVEWYKNGVLINGGNENTLSVSDSASYYVVNTNFCGSTASDEINVSPYSPETVVLTNVITPNGDGKNDAFEISQSAKNSELRIYDRWGLQVFEKEPYDNSWRAENLSSGTYFYFLPAGCEGDLIRGWIQVIKDHE